MNIQELLDYVKMNGGTTARVSRRGYDITIVTRKRGYCVSLYGYEKTINIDDDVTRVRMLIVKYIYDNRLILKNEGCYFGLWIDNGLLYLDISFIKRNMLQALLRGRLEKQRAIYDIMRGKSLFINDYNWLIDNVIVYDRVKHVNESITLVNWLSRERLNKCNASIVTINSNEGLIKAFKSYDTTIFILINNTLYFNRLNYSSTTRQHIYKFIDKYLLNTYDVKQLHISDWLRLHDVLGLYSQYPPRVEYEPISISCFMLLDDITNNR